MRLSIRVVHHHALRDQRDASIASLLGRAFSRPKLNLFPLSPYVGAAAQVKKNFKPIAEFLMPWSIVDVFDGDPKVAPLRFYSSI